VGDLTDDIVVLTSIRLKLFFAVGFVLKLLHNAVSELVHLIFGLGYLFWVVRLFAYFSLDLFKCIPVDVVCISHLLSFSHQTLLHVVFEVVLIFLGLFFEIIVHVCGLD